MSSSLLTKYVLLANGEPISLQKAVGILGSLRSYLTNGAEDQEWDVVYHLRQTCLGLPVEREPMNALIREGLAETDGTISPATRAVVLSAVRGDGRQLYLDSPFINPHDRMLADYLTGADYIRANLEKDEIDQLDQMHRFLADPTKVQEELAKSTPPLTDDEAREKAAEFLRRLNEERGQEPDDRSR